MAPPFLLASLLQASLSHIILIGAPLVRKMSQLHGLDDPIHDHGGTEAGSQANEKHLSTFVTPQRLQCGVVDNFHRAIECLFKVVSHPSASESMRLCNRSIPQYRP